jgi:hypothetical protein
MKVRKLGKSNSSEATLDQAMKQDGFVVGAEFDWVKLNGDWVVKLRATQSEKTGQAAQGVDVNESVLLEKTG